MKNFLQWFKNKTKIKRWITLILIGMILICYGISETLVLESLYVKDLAIIVLSFVIGFTCFIIGLIYIQRRTLELALEEDKFNEEDNLNIKALITKKDIYERGPNVVVIGGGTGLTNIIEGLKKYTSNITAIVTVSSYGNEPSTGVKELKLKPIEDIKQSLISLSPNRESMEKLINHKFENSKLKNLSFGDIYLLAMQEIYGDFAKSIEGSSNVLSMYGKVLPVTLDEMTICAELQDGTIVEAKDEIPRIVTEKVTKINRVFISPSNCRTAPGIIEAIHNADSIIIGPGSLYTNVIPNLLMKNVSKAIRESKALKIYISNIMTEIGQTDDYDVSDHINAIIEHAGAGIIDYCIADTGEIIPEIIRKYNEEGRNIVNIDTQRIRTTGVRLIQENISQVEGDKIKHNSDEIARIIIELICGDLRFKDKQTDEQYILLNSRLKEQNKNNKPKKKEKEKKEKKNRFKKTSKFIDKYQDRIISIKESENTRKENIKIHKKAQKLIDEEEKKEKEKFIKDTYKKK